MGERETLDKYDKLRGIRKQKAINEEFAARTRTALGNIDDDLPLTELRVLPQRRISRTRGRYAQNPPEEWKKFWKTLTSTELSQLSRALSQALKAGFDTVGSLRLATKKEILEGHRSSWEYPAISEIYSNFLKDIFSQSE